MAKVHEKGDQFFRVEKGKGEVVIDGKRTKIKGDDAFIIPAGARHNVINTDYKPLRLYTLYSPPQHRDAFIAATKADAEASHDGRLLNDLKVKGSLFRHDLAYFCMAVHRGLKCPSHPR